jgi:SNF2 family DNA or RNA helicase
MGKTVTVIALILADGAAHRAHRAPEQHWQLALREVARSSSYHGFGAVVPDRHRITEYAAWKKSKPALKELCEARGVKLKTTIVLVAVTILGQWHDELKKYAPGLNVVMYHSSAGGAVTRSVENGTIDMRAVDVLLCSPHKKLPDYLTRFCRFHRVIVDESHEICSKARQNHSWMEHATHRWAVTGTPITSSLAALSGQAIRPAGAILSQLSGCNLSRMQEMQFNRLVTNLRKVMIRHTKAQRIGGAQALALPTLQSETVWLDMNTVEKTAYKQACEGDAGQSRFRSAMRDGSTGFALEMTFCRRRQTCSNDYSFAGKTVGLPNQYQSTLRGGGSSAATVHKAFFVPTKEQFAKSSKLVYRVKGRQPTFCMHHPKETVYKPVYNSMTKLNALEQDLRQLQAAQPHFHAVVFTQHAHAHAQIADRLKNQGYEVYELSSSCAVDKRHQHIRDFQEEAATRRAKVMVITFKTGACGITLTKASRVYLFEPCIDPSHEAQAAGRIHRLGQSKEVLVKRFCFRRTIEEKVVRLHRKMHQGAVQVVDGHMPAAGVRVLSHSSERQ